MCEQLAQDIGALWLLARKEFLWYSGVCDLPPARYFLQALLSPLCSRCWLVGLLYLRNTLTRLLPLFCYAVGWRKWSVFIARVRSHLVRDRFVRSDDQRHRHRAEPSDTTQLLILIRALTSKKYVWSSRALRIVPKIRLRDICKTYNMHVRSYVSRAQPISSEQPRPCVKQATCLNMNTIQSHLDTLHVSRHREDFPLANIHALDRERFEQVTEHVGYSNIPYQREPQCKL